MTKSMAIKNNSDYGLSIISSNRTIAIIRNYFHKHSIVRLVINNEWAIGYWDNILVLIEFRKQSIHYIPFHAILSNNNAIFVESISDAKKMIVAYCFPKVNLLKENGHGFPYQVSKQSNSHSTQYHYELSLTYSYKSACCCRKAIVHSVCCHWDEIHSDCETVEIFGIKLRHNLRSICSTIVLRKV